VRKLIAGLAIGIGAAGLVLVVGWAGGLETAELKTYDWRMRMVSRIRIAQGKPLVHPDIVFVEITDASIRDLAKHVGRWPWPRALQAMLIEYISSGKPKAIAFDVLFAEPERASKYEFLNRGEITSAQSDEELAKAVKAAGNVIMLADAVDAGLDDGVLEQKPWTAPPYRLGPAIEERPVITLPIPALAAAARELGHNFFTLDSDGPVRRLTPFVRKGDRYMPLLGVAAALAGAGIRPDEVVLEGDTIRVRDRRIPLVPMPVRSVKDPTKVHDQQTMLVNFRAPALVNGEQPYPSYEAGVLIQSLDQVASGEKPDLPPETFKDKIVFVGISFSGLVDAFGTPMGEGTMPGIQVHASVADSILSNQFIEPVFGWALVLATISMAILVGLMSARLAFSIAAVGSLVVAATWIGALLTAFDRGLWLPMAQPILGVALALFTGTAYRYFVEDAEKRKVSRLFGRYVSRDVYTQLLANPGLAELGGVRREMTVLFSDLRGFTSITENGEPEALVKQLNEYFTEMVDIVFRNGGTVDKFVGDMVMALFGAPVDDVNHPDAAVTAAVEMVRKLGELNQGWAAEGRVQLDIGIGINSGDMIAGNIGSSQIMSYTVIGDNVNLGARLESLNKDYKTRIIMSEATRGQLTRRYDVRPLGGVVVKGKTRPVEIFEVIVPSPLVSADVEKATTAVEEKTL
jgi:adenylate cyclase